MRPVAQSEMKEISLDDDDDDIYEYIDEDRDDRRTGRHSLDAIRDAARVANIQPVTQLPPRRRVLVTEGNFFLGYLNSCLFSRWHQASDP